MQVQRFSVLICTYNRPELLRKSLQALIEGTQEKPDQIVVVNGGNERADQVVESFMGGQGIEVKLVKTVNKNLAASRNIGLPHCTGEIIAMTDDDAEVFPDWVTQMKRAHREHPEAGAVGGEVLGTNTDSLVGKVADLITFPSWPEPRYVRTLPGVNISYKCAAVADIGPQDETLFRGEDVDFNWRVKQLGYEIYFDLAIKVYHHHRPTLRGFLNQHYMYGRAYYLVRRKWPEMYCVYPHGFRRGRDVLKTVNFCASLLYQPFLSARRLPNWKDRFLALPVLFTAGIVWKWGMAVQGLRLTR
ncbi:MAG: glycosyltransferase [Anaerolineales bacterium]|nr:glycosyltransferase [Chloroflexota bacterium]MBL6980705.1 glycosyltransferase [Anaerolineales bacterium]